MADNDSDTTLQDCVFCEGTGKYSEIIRDGFIPRVITRDCPRTGHAVKSN